jgi:hypothetical protein
LLRDLAHVERYQSPSPHWTVFAKKLRRLVGDGIRLSRWEDRTVPEYVSRRDRLHTRLDELIAAPWKDKQAKRLLKRFRRHRDDLLTFLGLGFRRLAGNDFFRDYRFHANCCGTKAARESRSIYPENASAA